MPLAIVDCFPGKQVRSFYIKDKGQCLVAPDAWRAAGYKRAAYVKALEKPVPKKYKMRLQSLPKLIKTNARNDNK